jgi:hypothetical protein
LRRREFIAGAAGAAARARVPQPTVPIIGWLDLEPPQRGFVEGFRQGLAEFGFP